MKKALSFAMILILFLSVGAITNPVGAEESSSVGEPQSAPTDYPMATEDPVKTFETLMGFTKTLIKWQWNETKEGEKEEDTPLDDITLKWKVFYGIDIDISCGLRLPLRILLEYPERMECGQDYALNATLIPFDRPDFYEYFWSFEVRAFLKIWIDTDPTGEEEWTKIIDKEYGPKVGEYENFRPCPGNAIAITNIEIPLWSLHLDETIDVKIKYLGIQFHWILDIDLLTLKLVIYPSVVLDNVTADVSADGDARVGTTNLGKIVWDKQDQTKEFNIQAGDYDPTTDNATIHVSNLKYNFACFSLGLGLKLDFGPWINWLVEDYTTPIYYFPQLSLPISDLYLRVHKDYPSTLDVPILVEKRRVDLCVTPKWRSIAADCQSTTYSVCVTLKDGNGLVNLAVSGLPSDATATFIPASGYPTFCSTLKVTTTTDTPSGVYTLTITGSGRCIFGSTCVQLTVKPKITNFSVWTNPFSPNGDGCKDSTKITASFTETVSWTLDVEDSAGYVIRTWTGTGKCLEVIWDGKDSDGEIVLDGDYKFVLSGISSSSGIPLIYGGSRTVTVDTTSPIVTDVSANPSSFNPSLGETTTIGYTLSEPCYVMMRIYSSSSVLVRTLLYNAPQNAGSHSTVWNGKDSSGNIVPPGTYKIKIWVLDKAGNRASPYPIETTVTVL